MALKITNNETNGTSVVTLDGRIVLGEESKSLREKLKGLIAEGNKQIVLNMDNITYIDSTGLGALVAAQVSAKTHGASLKLCNLGRRFPGTLATHQAGDGIRGLQYGSSRCSQLLKLIALTAENQPHITRTI